MVSGLFLFCWGRDGANALVGGVESKKFKGKKKGGPAAATV